MVCVYQGTPVDLMGRGSFCLKQDWKRRELFFAHQRNSGSLQGISWFWNRMTTIPLVPYECLGADRVKQNKSEL